MVLNDDSTARAIRNGSHVVRSGVKRPALREPPSSVSYPF